MLGRLQLHGLGRGRLVLQVQLGLERLRVEIQTQRASALVNGERVVRGEVLQERDQVGLALEGHLQREVWNLLQEIEDLGLGLVEICLLRLLVCLDEHLQGLFVLEMES